MVRKLILHADNRSGQKKNRFVLFFCLLQVFSGEYEPVELCFMVPGDTKNDGDSSIGHVNGLFRNNDVLIAFQEQRWLSSWIPC